MENGVNFKSLVLSSLRERTDKGANLDIGHDEREKRQRKQEVNRWPVHCE